MSPTLMLDDDYPKLGQILSRTCARHETAFEVKDLNTQGFGDLLFYDKDSLAWSAEIKGSAEACGGLNHLEKQLQAQAENCDRQMLLIYGPPIEPAPDGNCYGYALNGVAERKIWERGHDAGVERTYARRYINQNYIGYKKKLARFYSEFGIEVVEAPSLEALADTIWAIFSAATTEGRTFSRYIPEKVRVNETDPAKARFMRQLMGLEAGIGEEIAAGICEAFISQSLHSAAPTMKELVWHLENHEASILASAPLRNGNRRVGPAAVKRLREALGL